MKEPIQALYFNIGMACSITQGTGVKIYNWNRMLSALPWQKGKFIVDA